MNLTTAQQKAIAARGNVLVMAGAGTGKTRVLVERCLDCLLNERPRASLDQILVVTFTEAAAAEVRERLRSRLEQELSRAPADPHWQEQLALFETAHIGTLHSFCLELIRQHFYELELDPQLTVLPEEEARLLADETLDALLKKHYEGEGAEAEQVQRLIQIHGNGADGPIRRMVLSLHHYSQTLPEPESWFKGQVEMFSDEEPKMWQTWYIRAVEEWRREQIARLHQQAAGNPVAKECLAALSQGPEVTYNSLFQSILATTEACPYKKKSLWLKPLQGLYDDAAFLGSLAPAAEGPNPLHEDWSWSRAPMLILLELARQFGARYAEAKRELGSVDFHDLEQHALRLLWDPKAGQPTAIAQHWRDQLRFLFVDEYQDINAAQDKIIECLARARSGANRFLVGDIKQSIYRFRLANPAIFQNYSRAWRNSHGTTIPLVENFRSREGILNFINAFFERTMRRELGGVDYDQEARLVAGSGKTASTSALNDSGARAVSTDPCCVELHVRLKGQPEGSGFEAQDELNGLEEAAKEARFVALRLARLKADAHPVWDEQRQTFRPVEWNDMAVLLRAPSLKAETYAREFSRLGVPLQVERGGFYQSLEITDLLSLLQILDNPRQDLPLLAVLHSPLVGLSLDQLATIRLAAPKAQFWVALTRWHETAPAQPENPNANLRGKVEIFLERFGRWRRLARQLPLSTCLELLLAETCYDTWLRLQPHGEQRRAKVRRLVALAQRFDQLQRQGLFRFLNFIEAQQRAESEPEVGALTAENAVRFLSIHQSKGLEFPIVVAADLGKSFNLSDLNAEIILDETYGLCPQVNPPKLAKRYPSLAHWLAARRQKLELLGEELRLLYVAMTRARDRLILSACVSRTRFKRFWAADANLPDPAEAGSAADWVAVWFRSACEGVPDSAAIGAAEEGVCFSSEQGPVRWQLYDDSELARQSVQTASTGDTGAASPGGTPLTIDDQVQQRFVWKYPFVEATLHPAKTSVSALRRKAVQLQEEAQPWRGQAPTLKSRKSAAPRGSKALDIGNAHHTFLQFVHLENAGSVESLKAEAARLQGAGLLSAEEGALLDFKGMEAFWRSKLGAAIRAHPDAAHRELPFTFRMSPAEVGRLVPQAGGVPLSASAEPAAASSDEFVVIQGVADLALILPDEIRIVDFKTDRVRSIQEAPLQIYEPQLKLYARALSVIYNRPVSQAWLWFLAARDGVAVRL